MTTRTTRRAIESDDELLRFEPETPDFSVEFDQRENDPSEGDALISSELPSPLDSDYEERLQAAQEQLQTLRQQQEEIERQKQELEELNQQQRRFVSGRSDLNNQLSRAVSMLEREAKEARRRADQFEATRDAFDQHLDAINAIKPENWNRTQLRNELGQALAMVEDATDDFERQMTKINSLRQVSLDVDSSQSSAPVQTPPREASQPSTTVSTSLPTDFKAWFKMGLAFTLPMVAFGILALLVSLIF